MVQNPNLPIGLADSELEGYLRRGKSLTVEVRAWNGRQLVFSFHGVISVTDMLAGSFSDFIQDSPVSEHRLDAAIHCTYEVVPTVHSYHVYSFLDLDDCPSLEVVALSYDVAVR